MTLISIILPQFLDTVQQAFSQVGDQESYGQPLSREN